MALSYTLPAASDLSYPQFTLSAAGDLSSMLPAASDVSSTLPAAGDLSSTLPATSDLSSTLPAASDLSSDNSRSFVPPALKTFHPCPQGGKSFSRSLKRSSLIKACANRAPQKKLSCAVLAPTAYLSLQSHTRARTMAIRTQAFFERRLIKCQQCTLLYFPRRGSLQKSSNFLQRLFLDYFYD